MSVLLSETIAAIRPPDERAMEHAGALLAWPVVGGAVRVPHEMATVDAAGASEK